MKNENNTFSIGSFYSWECLSDTVVLKHCDKSFFEFKNSGIPQEITWFFGSDELQYPDRKDITIIFNNKEYRAFTLKTPDDSRVRLYWDSTLKGEFASVRDRCPSFPTARFQRIADSVYQVQFIDFDRIQKDDPIPRETSVISESEGKRVSVWTTKYERSSKNRSSCIRNHGTRCAVCGFDFGETYGELGKDYIEVHHIKPLADLHDEVEINPITDLIPLCSNCHSMIHRRAGRVLTVEELKSIVETNRSNS